MKCFDIFEILKTHSEKSLDHFAEKNHKANPINQLSIFKLLSILTIDYALLKIFDLK